LAANIVAHRDANGRFKSRSELKKVPRLGPKAFEQAAGFLKITGGNDPLDASSVHPEAYPVVRRILSETGREIATLIGDAKTLRALKPEKFTDEKFGVPTVADILRELEKPGRDPRPEFRAAEFKEGVETIDDLKPGMILEGAVTNVAAFGAFVDIGVHQDGLVHISAMSQTFVKDPRDVVRSGDIVKVKVLEVDKPRKRIALTTRLSDDATPASRDRSRSEGAGLPHQNAPQRQAGRQAGHPAPPAPAQSGGALAEALRRAAENKGANKR
ncbi:MAG: S1 RNA-binding domain-containing protein, partial [Alphaproteobacteria bacterium]|nr:S1 RNA-binding domain-containing protein [Alphaproteobacteria bacterium]